MKSIKSSKNDISNVDSIKEVLKIAGPLIKSAREAKKLSSEELANELRIGEEQLLAIEDCQDELLPEDVFIKAMVRRISEKLNLNLSQLEDLSTQEQLKGLSRQSKNAIDFNFKKLSISLIAIISLILGVLWPRIIVNLFKVPNQNNTNDTKLSKAYFK